MPFAVRKSFQFCSVIVVLALPLLIPFASAQPRLSDLKTGMTFSDVEGAWGEPYEKIENEVRRTAVWRYQSGAAVTFKENRLASWLRDGVSPTGRVANKNRDVERAIEEKLSKATTSNQLPPEINPDTRDLVREIAREVPSGPDVPYTDPGVSAINNTTQAVVGSQIVQPPPQINMYNNPPVNGNQGYIEPEDE